MKLKTAYSLGVHLPSLPSPSPCSYGHFLRNIVVLEKNKFAPQLGASIDISHLKDQHEAEHLSLISEQISTKLETRLAMHERIVFQLAVLLLAQQESKILCSN